MSLRIRCRHCQNVFTIESSQAGTIIRCPGCQHSVKVPAGSVAKKEPPSSPAPSKPSARVPTPPPANPRGPEIMEHRQGAVPPPVLQPDRDRDRPTRDEQDERRGQRPRHDGERDVRRSLRYRDDDDQDERRASRSREDSDDKPRQRSRKRQNAGMGITIATVAGAVVLLVALVGGGMWWYLASTPQPVAVVPVDKPATNKTTLNLAETEWATQDQSPVKINGSFLRIVRFGEGEKVTFIFFSMLGKRYGEGTWKQTGPNTIEGSIPRRFRATISGNQLDVIFSDGSSGDLLFRK